MIVASAVQTTATVNTRQSTVHSQTAESDIRNSIPPDPTTHSSCPRFVRVAKIPLILLDVIMVVRSAPPPGCQAMRSASSCLRPVANVFPGFCV